MVAMLMMVLSVAVFGFQYTHSVRDILAVSTHTAMSLSHLLNFGVMLFAQNTLRLCVLVFGFFVLFEIVPLAFGISSSIRRNLSDLIRFQLGRGMYAEGVGLVFLLLILYFHLYGGGIDLRQKTLILQVLIAYLSIDFVIYLAHFLVHKYRVPLLSEAHGFHHTVTSDMEWVNSRKEHVLVLGLFAAVFAFFFYIVYIVTPIVIPIVVAVFLLLNAFSHYRVPVSIPGLDHVFLFPKDHLRHHTEISGPYGVTLSVFDTIFGTRGKLKY